MSIRSAAVKSLINTLFRSRSGQALLLLAVFGMSVTVLFAQPIVRFIAFESEGTGATLTGGVQRQFNDTTASSNGFLLFSNTPPQTQIGNWQQMNIPTQYPFTQRVINGQDAYGSQYMVAAKNVAGVAYVGTSFQGMYKTTDAGSTWTKINTMLPTGCDFGNGKQWGMAIDPTNHNIVYVTSGNFFCSQNGNTMGVFKTTDGGQTWRNTFSAATVRAATEDAYNVTIDPSNPRHLLVSSHYTWGFTSGNERPPGILESLDGGDSWILHENTNHNWGPGNYVYFLGNSSTWLSLGQFSDGMWLTKDSGNTWTKVSDRGTTHGGGGVYQSPVTGWWYVTANTAILRSQDGGNTWQVLHNSPNCGAYFDILGDGYRLYAMSNYVGACSTYAETALESNDTQWSRYNNQTFIDAPFTMSMDPVGRAIYSSNQTGGVWKLQL